MKRKRLATSALWAGAVLLAAVGACVAEGPEEVRWSFSGEARFRPEWRDDADLNRDADDELRQGFMRLRVGLKAVVRQDCTLFVQVQDSRVAGEETSTVSNQKNLDLHQGYVSLNPGSSERLALTIGRQELAYGDHRLVGNFGWNNVGRAFDAVKLRFMRRSFALDGFLAAVSERTAGAGDTGSTLYGAYAQATPRQGAEYDGYALGFADHVAAAGETGRLGETRIHAIGLRGKGRSGRLDLTAEAVLETGTWNGDRLGARAAAAQAGATWGRGVAWRIFAGYDFATGDQDPADGRRQEFFNFFPTNHPHYGSMDYEGWRNLRSPYGGLAVTRGRHFVQAKLHRFALDEARGPWKDAAGNVLGSDSTGASGRNVGGEIDLTYRFAWQEKASLEAGLSRFDPGRFARRTRGGDASRWAYLMLTFGF